MLRQKGKVSGKGKRGACCGSRFLQEGSPDMLGAVLTPEAAPAGDVAGVVLGQQRVLLWQARHLDGVTQLHGLRQLDEGDVVAGIQSGGGEGGGGAWPHKLGLSSRGCRLGVKPGVTRSPP